MRDKGWLVQVLEEATRRVEAWPEWKKTADLQRSEQNRISDQEQSAEREERVAKPVAINSVRV